MGSEVPRFYWGNQPEEAEFYASQGVKNRQAFHQTPYGRLFTQSFHPINRETGDELPIKGTVYLTHGYGSDTGWLFQSIAIAYANWGYAAYCADLLGHGRSDGLRCYMGDFEAVAGASLHFFLSVRKDPVYADLPAFLFGESMGGAATMLMYLRSPPDTWTGLIFSAPLFVMPEDMKPSKLRLFLFGLLFGMADTWQAMPDKKMVGKAIRDPERLRIIASNPRRYTEPPRVGTMRELARICGYIQESFPKVTVPFLTVHGTEDGVTAPEGSKLLYEKAGSKDKSLILYEGYYHSLLQGESEENSKRVLTDLREWIDERTKRYGNGVSRVVNVDRHVAGSEEVGNQKAEDAVQ
ncbi:caffeoylshikimate esterase-like protein [Carex littledalei]|uniref:Caffeoylshikimate esterase-like protein n=1 Tax=Carex littledalei TaxID=544730 RepID=A0A833RCC1_9POAL|nr:caffeoylshikimate esterase-like protein [Carex littledalei]